MSANAETAAPEEVETVDVEIDGKSVKARKGATIIQVADEIGIHIPRFCYHRKLSIAANCRMCLVDVEKAPKPLPACATPVMDGMQVRTQSKRAVDAQHGVMEFLLINHPLDCPICDQGGECELQDLSMGFGRSVSRFVEGKRSVSDPDLGPLISTDMTRCIHCTRCVRFLDEISGSHELGAVGRGEDMKITNYVERSVDSELSGNVIDLCPVGALNNKPYRYSARAWELMARPMVSYHDCVGGNYFLHVLRGRIKRSVPRENDAVNESWMADRDRFGHEGLYTEDRLLKPQIKEGDRWREVEWDEAMAYAARGLRDVVERHGPDALGFLTAPGASTEEHFLAQRLARRLGTSNIDHRLRQLDVSDQDAMPAAPTLDRPIAEMDRADAVLLVGSNLRHDQPLLNLRVRTAWRVNGARVMAVNPVDYDFNYDLSAKLVSEPWQMLRDLAAVAKAAQTQGGSGAKPSAPVREWIDGAESSDTASRIAETLASGERACVLVGNFGQQHPSASAVRALAGYIAEATGAGLALPGDGANTAGAWLAGAVPHRGPGADALDTAGLSARQMLEEPRQGYVLYGGIEPAYDTALGAAAERAVEQAGLVICCTGHAGEAERRYADVLLPIGLPPEIDGSYVNCDGVWQFVRAGAGIPGEGRAGWKVLRVLGTQLGLDGFDQYTIDDVREALQGEVGQPDIGRYRAGDATGLAPPPAGAAGELTRIGDVPIYAVDAVVRRSPPLQATSLAQSAALGLAPADAQRLGVADGAKVRVQQDERQVELAVRVDARVPAGGVWLPAALDGSVGLGANVGAVHIEKG